MATYKHNKPDVEKWLSKDPLIKKKEKLTLEEKAKKRGWSPAKRARKGLDPEPVEESTIQKTDPIKEKAMEYLEESLIAKGPGMRYDAPPLIPSEDLAGPIGGTSTSPSEGNDKKSSGKKREKEKKEKGNGIKFKKHYGFSAKKIQRRHKRNPL